MPTPDGHAPSPLRTVARAATLGVVYFAAVSLATAISIPGVSIAPIRLPNAFAIVALLLAPPSTWWVYVLAIVPPNVYRFLDWTIAARYVLANSTEIVIAAAAVRRIAGPRPRLGHLRETLVFLAVAVVVAPMLGALIGASAVRDIYPAIPAIVSWRVWFLGDAVGNVAVVPALLALAAALDVRWRDVHVSVNVWRIVEGLAIGAGIVAGSLPTLGALGTNGSNGAGGATALSMLYVPFPLLVWSALRFGTGGAAAGNLLLATLAVMAALQRSGPFAPIDNPSGVLILQQFLLIASATALVLAAVAEERRRTLVALRLSEAKFERVFNASPDAVSLSRLSDGTMLEVNDGFEEATGIPRQMAIGRTAVDLEVWEDPDEREAIRRALAAGPVHNMIVRIRSRRGPTRLGLFSASTIDIDGEPCMLAVVRDITEHQEVKEALRDSEDRYRSLLDTATDVVLTIDGASRIETANGAFETLTGWTRDDWAGQPITAFLAPDDAAPAQGFIDSATRDATAEMREWRVRTKAGDWRVAEVKLSAYRRGGRIAGLLVIARDITERRRAEAERTRLEEQMAQVRKLEAVGQLAGGIAHDFNNILQAVLGFADLARDGVPPESATADHIDKVITSAERARTLTRQLLTFSRRETVTPRVLDVLAVIGEFNRILRRVLPANINLSLTSRAGAPFVVADRSHIEQIVMNLCVNAADAMPGGGTISVTVDREEVTDAFAAAHAWARPGNFVTIAVADTGSGIAPEHRPHIFEPFFTTKDIGKGTGLGLATVYGITQRYEGLIDVQSEVDRGTTFRIYLPAQVAPAADEELGDRADARRGHDELILVAEDEPLVRELAVSQLERAGYRVLQATDGETAIRLFEAHEAEIRLAFLDLMMPRGDGRTVRLAIRAKRPALPILFTTGYADSAHQPSTVVEIGDRILRKPYSTAALLATVRELLDARVS